MFLLARRLSHFIISLFQPVLDNVTSKCLLFAMSRLQYNQVANELKNSTAWGKARSQITTLTCFRYLIQFSQEKHYCSNESSFESSGFQLTKLHLDQLLIVYDCNFKAFNSYARKIEEMNLEDNEDERRGVRDLSRILTHEEQASISSSALEFFQRTLRSISTRSQLSRQQLVSCIQALFGIMFFYPQQVTRPKIIAEMQLHRIQKFLAEVCCQILLFLLL
tara:strand:- start:2636 stop:3298 length:663 start_codon:yes stop_codon:yes gene_type:complete